MNAYMDKHRTDVYLALLPDGECDAPLYPEERDALVRSTANPAVRRERYFVWRLLEEAVRASLGLELCDIGLRLEGERWTSERADISLSHSGGALAVAVSGVPVGVDIEMVSDASGNPRIAERFFNERERAEYAAASADERGLAFARIWTAKEAIFKSRRSAAFAPSEVDSHASQVYSRTVRLGEHNFALSVAVDNEPTVHIIKI